MIDISGLPKAKVLQALFNASRQQGMGVLDIRGASPMKENVAEQIIKAQQHFDYLFGRVMKVSLDSDSLDEWLFDRDLGEGAAARAIDAIR